MKSLKYKFTALGHSSLIASKKSEFYRTIKHSFTKEAYLDHVKVYADRSNLTKLRISAHRLEIEVGQWLKLRSVLVPGAATPLAITQPKMNLTSSTIVAYMRLQDVTPTRKLEK